MKAEGDFTEKIGKRSEPASVTIFSGLLFRTQWETQYLLGCEVMK